MIVEHLAIIGLGLIGGSLARAARAAGVVGYITGFDVDPVQQRDALKLGVVDAAPKTSAAAVEGADVVLLAVPVLEMGRALGSFRDQLPTAAVLTDVGSTKVSVISAVKKVFGRLPENYVPAHPIAGTEKTGVASADADLFRDRHVILTPHAATAAIATARVQQLWEAAGAHVDRMSPEHHDAIFAATSHLPHALAYTLVDMLARMDSSTELFNYAASGFRDFTRIAGSSPKMWHDIVSANREALLPLMDVYLQSFAELRDAIAADDSSRILQIFTRARDARERFQSNDQRRQQEPSPTTAPTE